MSELKVIWVGGAEDISKIGKPAYFLWCGAKLGCMDQAWMFSFITFGFVY